MSTQKDKSPCLQPGCETLVLHKSGKCSIHRRKKCASYNCSATFVQINLQRYCHHCLMKRKHKKDNDRKTAQGAHGKQVQKQNVKMPNMPQESL